jgi:hypothetical protein
MGQRSKKSNAARLRLARQSPDLSSDHFVSSSPQVCEPCDPDFLPESSDEYSADSGENSDDVSGDESEMESRASLILGFPWRGKAVSQKRKSVYLGNSKRSKSRKWGVHGTYTIASQQTRPITDYFLEKTLPEPEINHQSDAFVIEEEDEECESDFDERLHQLDQMLQGTAMDMKNMTAFEFLQYTAVSRYLHSLKDPDTRKVASSQAIAAEVYGKGSYMATVIRSWASSWIENGSFPPSRQGCHQKTKSIIDDEDAIARSLSFIRSQDNCLSPKSFVEFVNTILLPEIGVYYSKKSISVKTARIWLQKLGLVPTPRKKGEFIIFKFKCMNIFVTLHAIICCCSFIEGIYFDGHERADVVQYRDQFLQRMQQLEKLMPLYQHPNMEEIMPSPEALNGMFSAFLLLSLLFINDITRTLQKTTMMY